MKNLQLLSPAGKRRVARKLMSSEANGAKKTVKGTPLLGASTVLVISMPAMSPSPAVTGSVETNVMVPSLGLMVRGWEALPILQPSG